MTAKDTAEFRRLFKLSQGLPWPVYYMLPHTVGLWPVSSSATGGTVYDVSGNGRTLSDANNPTFGVDHYMPYVDFNGSNEYLFRADESGLDITGAMTMGGWWYFDDATPASEEALMGKYAETGNNRHYLLKRDTSANIIALVSSDGTAETTQASTETVGAATWAFCAMRYIPSTELSVFVGQLGGTGGFLNEDLNTTSIPASIDSGLARFAVGAWDTSGTASNYLDGRASMLFLCADDLSDNHLNMLYQQTRRLLGDV